MDGGAAGPERREIGEPSDAFRRASVVLGLIGADLMSLLWLFGAGGFVLLPPPNPGSKLGASRIVAPLVVGLLAVVVLLYRRQEDEKVGVRAAWLFRAAMFASLLTAGIGGFFLAGNLVWIFSQI